MGNGILHADDYVYRQKEGVKKMTEYRRGGNNNDEYREW